MPAIDRTRAALPAAIALLLLSCGDGTPGEEDALDGTPDVAEDGAADAADDDAPGDDATPDAGDGTDAAGGPGVTFFVVGDTHCDPEPDSGNAAMVAAIVEVTRSGRWPTDIHGVATGFADEPIGTPAGVILVGDITGSGDVAPWSDELATFRGFYESGFAEGAIPFPVYVGLGNHDVDRDDPFAENYRRRMWEYVEERHAGEPAPVPVGSFDAESRNYSWDWEGVHLVQTHRFAGDTGHGLASSLPWLADDLAANAPDRRPVVIFQHYGLDTFGTEDRWWTEAERTAWLDVVDDFHVVAVIAGHSHFAMRYEWSGLPVFQVNNAKGEFDAGNRDGAGSFAVFRITDDALQLVTCRWIDETGAYELIAPYVRRPLAP